KECSATFPQRNESPRIIRCEQLQYNLLFRWFVGMEMDEVVWNHDTTLLLVETYGETCACTQTISRRMTTLYASSRYVFIKVSCFATRWLASSSSLRADSAKRGHAISFVTLASVALADSFFDFFF